MGRVDVKVRGGETPVDHNRVHFDVDLVLREDVGVHFLVIIRRVIEDETEVTDSTVVVVVCKIIDSCVNICGVRK